MFASRRPSSCRITPLVFGCFKTQSAVQTPMMMRRCVLPGRERASRHNAPHGLVQPRQPLAARVSRPRSGRFSGRRRARCWTASRFHGFLRRVVLFAVLALLCVVLALSACGLIRRNLGLFAAPAGWKPKKKAKLVVEKGRDGVPPPSAVAGGTATLPGIRIKIPKADGNPDCRVYGYQIVVAGEDKTAALKKNCYARGYCMGMDGEGPYPRESGIVQICSGVARRYMVEYPIVSLVGYSRRPCQGGTI